MHPQHIIEKVKTGVPVQVPMSILINSWFKGTEDMDQWTQIQKWAMKNDMSAKIYEKYIGDKEIINVLFEREEHL